MPGVEPPELHRLMDELDEAIVSERNKARLNRPPGPAVVVEIENPIAWVHLFHYDPRRYFHDPVFNLCQQLRQKLWRFRNIDDDVPIDNFVPAWLGHYPEYTFFGMHIDVRAHGGPEIQTDQDGNDRLRALLGVACQAPPPDQVAGPRDPAVG